MTQHRATPAPVIADDELRALAEGYHASPHSVLGQHPLTGAGLHRAESHTMIRTRCPLATSVSAEFANGQSFPLQHIGYGIWSGVCGVRFAPYRIHARYGTGHEASVWTTDDPYRFAPTIGELDLHLIAEGRHEQLWQVLGAHSRTMPGVDGDITGVAFTVWAPHARAVRVACEANQWDSAAYAMRTMGSSGVWELFISGIPLGTVYKYEILTAHGDWVMKADPMAARAEIPPGTASVVWQSHYTWDDDEWMSRRAATNPHTRPMSIYELHLGSWRPHRVGGGHGYREIADELIEYLQWLGYTHVEFMPLAEHPFSGSWGYQVTGYFAVTSRFGSPDDLKYLIDRLHGAGIGVLMDWVPGHFPKDEWALGRFDGEALYEHSDPRRGEQKEWGTYVPDFGNPRVRNFLVANALFWLEEMHVDGLRVDAVASMLYLDYSRETGEWLPNVHGGREHYEAISFLQEVSATAYKRNPGIVMIAEESTSWPGVTAMTEHNGLGFGFKWNMGWMHDSLEYLSRNPMHRSYHHNELTFSFLYAFSEHFVLPISHDEVVHGKGSLLSRVPGDSWQQFATVRAYLGFMWAHPGKKLLFMGQEFAQRAEWSHEQGLDWWALDQQPHRQVADYLGTVNKQYRALPALWQLDDEPAGFAWVEGGAGAANVIAFLRFDRGASPLLCIVNFAGIPHESVRLGVPTAGRWREVLNSDALEFGGSGVGNLGSITAVDDPWGPFPASATFTLPPLGTLWFVPE